MHCVDAAIQGQDDHPHRSHNRHKEDFYTCNGTASVRVWRSTMLYYLSLGSNPASPGIVAAYVCLLLYFIFIKKIYFLNFDPLTPQNAPSQRFPLLKPRKFPKFKPGQHLKFSLQIISPKCARVLHSQINQHIVRQPKHDFWSNLAKKVPQWVLIDLIS